jgi:lauroyl/myristoyl acyltransferase
MKAEQLYRLGLFKAANRLARWLPRGIALRVGAAIGRQLCRNRPVQWRDQRENLRIVTGLDGPALDALCDKSFVQFSRMLADYFYCTNVAPERVRPLIKEWRGYEHVEMARTAGRGTIVVTAHLGHWELGGIVLALHGLPLTVITLDEPTTELTRWRELYRQKLGIKTIAVGADKFAFVEMIQALRRNEFVAMLVDRPYAGTGSPVTLFGHRTEFSSAPALLWEHTGATVLPAFILQEPDDRYLSVADPVIPLDNNAGIAGNTQRIADVFGAVIRAHPEQWFNFVRIFESAQSI